MNFRLAKDTDLSKKNIEYWSPDRENATVFFSKQAAEEHIELYAQKLPEYKTKIIHDSELFSLEAKRKKYIETFDAYWYQQRVLIPMEVYL